MDMIIRDCLMRINPFLTEEDVLDARMVNEYDVLFTFKDGRKIIIDSQTYYHREMYPDDYEFTDEQYRKEFGRRLRTIMRRKGINQEELANCLGTTQTVISRYITGDAMPDCVRTKRIANILNCSTEDFYYKHY